MRRLTAIIAVFGTVLLPRVANAKRGPEDQAKATATELIASYIRPSNLGGGVAFSTCDRQTSTGFFHKRRAFLDSCARGFNTVNGGLGQPPTVEVPDLQVFVIVNVSKGSVPVDSPYLRTQLRAFCDVLGSGPAYSAAVSGKLQAVFAGVPREGVIPNALRDDFVGQIKNVVPGQVTTSETPCS
jgi:hypothetical protein